MANRLLTISCRLHCISDRSLYLSHVSRRLATQHLRPWRLGCRCFLTDYTACLTDRTVSLVSLADWLPSSCSHGDPAADVFFFSYRLHSMSDRPHCIIRESSRLATQNCSHGAPAADDFLRTSLFIRSTALSQSCVSRTSYSATAAMATRLPPFSNRLYTGCLTDLAVLFVSV